MLALGCIQARRCNTNGCPTGVATTDEALMRGLDPEDKKTRIFNYQLSTVHAFGDLLGAAGMDDAKQIGRAHVHRRISREAVRTYAELFPPVANGAFLRGEIPERLRTAVAAASAETFAASADTVYSKVA